MRILRIVALVSAMVIPSTAFAEPMLTVKEYDSEGDVVTRTYTSQDLRVFNEIAVVTANDFVTEETRFEGPLLRDLIGQEKLNLTSEISVTALDGYSTSIPVDEVYKYDVIIATSMDGRPLSEEPQGPFWVIYPMTDNPELQDGYNSRLIWQLSDIEYNMLSKD